MARQKDTSDSLLRMLAKTYTFGPVMDRRIAKVLAEPSGEPEWPASIPSTMPLRRAVLSTTVHGLQKLNMGEVHGFSTAIYYNPVSKEMHFKWGCRRIQSEAEARNHWRYGLSRISGASRHHAPALIDYVAAYCKWKGWAW